MKTLVKNAADPSQVKEAETKARLTENREVEDLRSILNTQQGRRFLWRYLSLTGLYRTSYVGGDSSLQTHFNEGQRNIGLALIAEITAASPEAYLLMMKEAEDKE